MRFHQVKNLRLITFVAACFMVATMCTAETVWTDVTKRFVTNAAFDDDSNEGWTWDATTGTVGVSAGCLRFYSGTCTFSYQLSNLPKGTYRLSVLPFLYTGISSIARKSALDV